MKLFKRLRLVDKYYVEKSKEPNDNGKYILFHEVKSLRGYNCQRVFKGSFKQCHIEKKKLEEKMRDDIYKWYILLRKNIYILLKEKAWDFGLQ